MHERFHACSSLRQALSRVKAKRLVVGHTPQLCGANCECEGEVWRIDVGMSSGVLNRPVQILEIKKDPKTNISRAKVLSNLSQSSSDLEEDAMVEL